MVNYSICKRDTNSLSHLPRDFVQVSSEKSNNNNEQGFLQILLFINKRPGSQEQIQAIRKSLNNLKIDYDYPFEFQVIDVEEQPYMAEHFKLIATPALLKIYPEPRQTLTGTDLIAKLEYWWPRWQRSIAEYWHTHNSQPQSKQVSDQKLSVSSIDCAVELMQMSDEIFRLKQEKEQLQAQLRFKDRIVAVLAHDLRNPLTAVSLALETLASTQKTANSANSEFPRSSTTLMERLIKQALYQVRTIDRMITDILERPRGKSTELHIQPEKLDVGALCSEVIISFRDRLKSKDLQLKTDIPHDLPLVYADRERIRQVIVNLLDNAIKYTPKQGEVQVLILDRTTQKIQVTISDSGPGIPKENRNRIFEDSFRLKRDESQEGYGIGLALCQRIILSHYGKIWVDSSPNNGSCFHFTLPVYR